MTNDVAYVTQEMWDRAQAALCAALPVIEERVPPLSTAGTMASLRDQVRAAIVAAPATRPSIRVEPNGLEIHRLGEQLFVPLEQVRELQRRAAEPPAPYCACQQFAESRTCEHVNREGSQ